MLFLISTDNDKSNEDRQKEEELLLQIHKLVETRDFLVDDVEFERLRCASMVSLQLASSPLVINIESHCTYKATRYRDAVHLTCSLLEKGLGGSLTFVLHAQGLRSLLMQIQIILH